MAEYGQMVNQILLLLKNYTFKISLWFFIAVFVSFTISLIVYYINTLVKVVQEPLKKRMQSHVYDLILGIISFDDLYHLYHSRLKRYKLIEVFASTISLIIGSKREYLKEAIEKSGLIKLIQRHMSSISPANRLRSVYLLGIVGKKEHAPILLSVLKDRNPKVVSSAIVALGELREKKSIPSILKFFSTCSIAHAWLVAGILPFFGNECCQFIKPYLCLGLLPKDKLLLLIKVVTVLKSPECLEELLTLYTNSDDLDIKTNSLIALGKINDLSTVKLVLDALFDPYWQIRATAANIVGEMALKGAVWRLLPLIKDKNWYVRKNASRALIKMGKIGIHALINFLEVDDRYARDMIIQTLEEYGIITMAVEHLARGSEQEKNEAKKIINALIQKGYTNYLQNFISTVKPLESLMNIVHKNREG